MHDITAENAGQASGLKPDAMRLGYLSLPVSDIDRATPSFAQRMTRGFVENAWIGWSC